MACAECERYAGHSTAHYDVWAATFDITEDYASSMVVCGRAVCRHCGQQAEFEYDETLIPKLKLNFLDNKGQ